MYSDKVLDELKHINANLNGIELLGISIHIDYNKTIYLEKGLVDELNDNGYGIFIHDV